MVSSPQQYREQQQPQRHSIPSVALAVSPHPDDAEVGAGATLARWAREGCRVVLVVCTNGDKGSQDPKMTSKRLATLRRQEQLAAAAVLGIKDVELLQHPDCFLEDDAEFRGELVRLIRQYRPEVVLSTDPDRRYMQHHDHRAAGRAALDACFPYARDPLSYPEHLGQGLKVHKVREVLFWGADKPNFYVDVSSSYQLKIEALRQHVSQGFQRRPRKQMERLFKERLSGAGKALGVPLAESFRRLEIRF